jgi:hypothetical protein
MIMYTRAISVVIQLTSFGNASKLFLKNEMYVRDKRAIVVFFYSSAMRLLLNQTLRGPTTNAIED